MPCWAGWVIGWLIGWLRGKREWEGGAVDAPQEEVRIDR